MLDTPSPFRVTAPPPLPVAQLALGKSPEHVAELIPRLFNLCRAAQAVGVRMALGLPVPDGVDLCEDIRRDHVMRLAVLLPTRLGLPRRTPIDWTVPQSDALLDGFPETPQAFLSYLSGGRGIAPLLRAVAAAFPGRSGTTGVLPVVSEETAFDAVALENSVATRHLDHPVMQFIEDSHGRGPLWRVVARALDLQAVERGILPEPRLVAPGCALVPAARGLYAVRARVEKGRVTELTRVTPSDHLLAPGGLMDQGLATVQTRDAAQTLVDILDPCVPLKLEEAGHA